MLTGAARLLPVLALQASRLTHGCWLVNLRAWITISCKNEESIPWGRVEDYISVQQRTKRSVERLLDASANNHCSLKHVSTVAHT